MIPSTEFARLTLLRVLLSFLTRPVPQHTHTPSSPNLDLPQTTIRDPFKTSLTSLQPGPFSALPTCNSDRKRGRRREVECADRFLLAGRAGWRGGAAAALLLVPDPLRLKVRPLDRNMQAPCSSRAGETGGAALPLRGVWGGAGWRVESANPV